MDRVARQGGLALDIFLLTLRLLYDVGKLRQLQEIIS
jgi:hypothetical protein